MQIRRNVWVFIGVIYVFFAGAANAASLSGVWTKTTDRDAYNITLLIVEDINVKAIGYGTVSGKPAIWFAEGRVIGNNLTLAYRYGKDATPPGWEREGTMQLVVSEDGQSMHGKASSVSGGWSGEIEFRRMKP